MSTRWRCCSGLPPSSHFAFPGFTSDLSSYVQFSFLNFAMVKEQLSGVVDLSIGVIALKDKFRHWRVSCPIKVLAQW
eukprot:13744819-Ditylum_brightwellii.AAC.1